MSRCSLCNSPRPATSVSREIDREATSSEATVSIPSSLDINVNSAHALSQQSSRLFSIDTNKTTANRKTLGAKRALNSSQRSLGLSRPHSLSID